MKVIILAAGYATRLYPLTLTRPKSLLPVAGKPMIEHVMDNVAPIGGLEEVYVVANHKFASQLEDWADHYRRAKSSLDFVVVDDGSVDESEKLGAIGDMHLVLREKRVQSDILVVAADNLFSQSLAGFGDFCRQRNAPVLAVYDVGSLAEIRKYNAITLDAEGRITYFEEKPDQPSSTLTGIALYYYPKEVLPLIHQYMEEGNHPDQPGRLVQWMYRRVAFYTWQLSGMWYDIGSKESLQEADRVFSKT